MNYRKKIFFIISFVTSLIIMTSCRGNDNTKSSKNSEETIGKYVYVTKDSILHLDLYCLRLSNLLDSGASKETGIRFIDTAQIISTDYYYCPECFNDSLYERIALIAKRNKEKQNK